MRAPTEHSTPFRYDGGMEEPRHRWFRFSLRSLLMTIAAMALLLGGWRAFGIWNKVDDCEAWAKHYAERAEVYRREAMGSNLSPATIAKLRAAGHECDLVSRKYRDIAARPWLRYPSYPQVPHEQTRAKVR